LNCPAIAVNVPVVDPDAIAIEFTVMAIPPVAPRLTLAPLAPAGPLRVTVQIAEAPGLSEAGLHAREPIVERAGLTCPPLAVTEIAVPLGADSMAPVTLTKVAADPEKVAETVATTPFAITFWFGPLATHSNPLGVTAHVNDFPAAVNDVPGVMERLVTLEGYVKVHCRLAPAEAVEDENERFRENEPPAAAILDDKASEDCASAIYGENSNAMTTAIPQ
jgi:hypothetical protein